ncbi:hypothetical protein [Microcoleus sp. OTE_8_concoct_300]
MNQNCPESGFAPLPQLPDSWLLPEVAAGDTTTATLLSIGTNVKIMSIY